MKISEDDVRHVAKLAHLQLHDDQIHAISGTFSEIMTYVDKLNQVDTTDVTPMSHVVKMENVFREDAVNESLPVEDALQNAPDRIGAYYRVPKIIE